MKRLAMLWMFVGLGAFATIPRADGQEKGVARGAADQPLFRWHFAGRNAMAQSTNALRLRRTDALPATADLRGQIATNLALACFTCWRSSLPAGAADQSALLAPLFHDFLSAETCLDVRGAVGRTESTLAIELNEDRALLWSTNLWRLASAWRLGTPRDAASGASKGWEVKKTVAPNLFRFFRSGDWVVIGLGQDRLSLLPAWLETTGRTKRPVPALVNTFLDTEADIPGLKQWLPFFANFSVPRAHLTLRGLGEYVRTEVRLQFPGKVPYAPQPWIIPTNLVCEPLTSFTVARGVAGLLGQVRGASLLGLSPMPDQITSWGLASDQCRVYWAAPMPRASNVLEKLWLGWPKFMETNLGYLQGQFMYASNRAEVVWGGVPWLFPYIKTAQINGTEFLTGGIFPAPKRPTPAPVELFAELGHRPELLYYDWEMTSERLIHGRQAYELANIMSRRQSPGAQTPSKKWLAAVGPSLSNSITEVTITGPQEITLTRKSHIGLTGFELATLSAWLDSASFPRAITMMPLISAGRPKGTNAPARRPNPASPAPVQQLLPVPAKP